MGPNKTEKAISIASKHARQHEERPSRVENEFRLDSNDCCFVCYDVSSVVGYDRNARYNLSCLLQTYCCLLTPTKNCPLSPFLIGRMFVREPS